MTPFQKYTSQQEKQITVDYSFLEKLESDLLLANEQTKRSWRDSYFMRVIKKVGWPLTVSSSVAAVIVGLAAYSQIGLDTTNGFLRGVKKVAAEDDTLVHHVITRQTGPAISYEAYQSHALISEHWSKNDDAPWEYSSAVSTLLDGTIVEHYVSIPDYVKKETKQYTLPKWVQPPAAGDASCILNNPSDGRAPEPSMVDKISEATHSFVPTIREQRINQLIAIAKEQNPIQQLLLPKDKRNNTLIDLGGNNGLHGFRIHEQNSGQILDYYFDATTFKLKKQIEYIIPSLAAVTTASSQELIDQYVRPENINLETDYLTDEYVPFDQVDQKVWSTEGLVEINHYWDNLLEGKEPGCYNGKGEKLE